MVAPSLVLDVVCLCAAWCGTCREYEAVFVDLRQALPQHRYRWIDIEDEADLVGEVDVQTFPTLMIAFEGRVMFAGPVLPRLGDALRLVEVQQGQAQRGVLPGAALLNLPADQLEAFTSLAGTLA